MQQCGSVCVFVWTLMVLVRLQQSGRAAGAVARRGEAEGGAKVAGELPESTHQPRVAGARVLRSDGYYGDVLGRSLGPDQQLTTGKQKGEVTHD